MSKEGEDWGIVCDGCASQPNPALAALPLQTFVGQNVKIGVPTGHPTHHTEHIWVHVHHFEGNTIFGFVNVDPILAPLRYMLPVCFDRSAIEDIYREGQDN